MICGTKLLRREGLIKEGGLKTLFSPWSFAWYKPAKHYTYSKQRNLATAYGEMNSSKEKSFPNPSITFGNIFCLSSKRWLRNVHLKVETTMHSLGIARP